MTTLSIIGVLGNAEIYHRQPNVMVACAQAHVAQARDCIVVNYTIPRLRHMCLCAGNHNIGLPMDIQSCKLSLLEPDVFGRVGWGFVRDVILTSFWQKRIFDPSLKYNTRQHVVTWGQSQISGVKSA